MDYIPNSVRQLLLDGLGRLIRHLAGLSEEVRHGLIHVISRSVSESIESTLYGVSRQRISSMIETTPINQAGADDVETLPVWKTEPSDYDSDDDDDDQDYDQDYDRDDDSLEDRDSKSVDCIREQREPFPLPKRSTNPWWLTTAAGLCGLATWLGSTGLTPLATATSIIAGTILVFLG